MPVVFDVEHVFDCIASYLDIRSSLSLSRACKRTRDLFFDRVLGDHTYGELRDCDIPKEDTENVRSVTIKGRFPWSCFWEARALLSSSPPKVFGLVPFSITRRCFRRDKHIDPFKPNRRNPGWCKTVNLVMKDPAAFDRVIGVFSRYAKGVDVRGNTPRDFLSTLKHVTRLSIRQCGVLSDPTLSTMHGVSVLKIHGVSIDQSFFRNLPRNLRELHLSYLAAPPNEDSLLDLGHLPASLESLSVSSCRLSTGSLRRLPANLKTLRVAYITIDEHVTTRADLFHHLPGSLRSLHVRCLPFNTRLDHLPPGLKELMVSNQYHRFPPNYFCRLPEGLISFRVELTLPCSKEGLATNLLDHLALPPNLETLQVLALFWPNCGGGTKRVNVPNPPKTLTSIAVQGYAPILLQVGNTTVECATDSGIRRTATWKKSDDSPAQENKNDAKG